MQKTVVLLTIRLRILIAVYLSLPGVTCCGAPPAVQHATVSITNYNSIQIATYRCDAANGYATRGNNTIACLRAFGYASWSPTKVNCESKTSSSRLCKHNVYV